MNEVEQLGKKKKKKKKRANHGGKTGDVKPANG